MPWFTIPPASPNVAPASMVSVPSLNEPTVDVVPRKLLAMSSEPYSAMSRSSMLLGFCDV